MPSPVYPGSLRAGGFDVVIVCQQGAQVDPPVKYGATRALIELARELAAGGKSPVVVGLSERTDGLTDGIPFLAARDDAGLHKLLRRIGPVPTLIGCSRADVFVDLAADSRLIYQHGPHLPEGDFALHIIRRLRLPMVVVSGSSMKLQTLHGVPADQLHLVYNGYDSGVFKISGTARRQPHRIVFAGLGVPYKGLDIAVAAFALLRRSFQDAELEVFGACYDWATFQPASHWMPNWLTGDGTLAWEAIQRDLPGLSYHGEVAAKVLAQAFQQASILVMPSRVEETFGLVSIEAQACGCIPVLPARGGFPETMQSGITGYTYEPNTPEALARRIGELWTAGLPTDAQRVSAANWVARQFSWPRAVNQIAEVLRGAPAHNPRFWTIEAGLWTAAMSLKRTLRNWRRALETQIPAR